MSENFQCIERNVKICIVISVDSFRKPQIGFFCKFTVPVCCRGEEQFVRRCFFLVLFQFAFIRLCVFIVFGIRSFKDQGRKFAAVFVQILVVNF